LFSEGPFPYLTIAAGTGKADWLLAAKTKVYIIPRLESRQRRIKHIPAVLPEWGCCPGRRRSRKTSLAASVQLPLFDTAARHRL
jgi:hypothetical protein